MTTGTHAEVAILPPASTFLVVFRLQGAIVPHCRLIS
jgi:hypothetical protein